MRVALVAPDDFSIWIFRKCLIRLLKKRGHDVYVVSEYGEYAAKLELLGVYHVPIKIPRFISPVQDSRLFYSLFKIFRENKFDPFAPIGSPRAKIERNLLHHPKSFRVVRIQVGEREVITPSDSSTIQLMAYLRRCIDQEVQIMKKGGRAGSFIRCSLISCLSAYAALAERFEYDHSPS